MFLCGCQISATGCETASNQRAGWACEDFGMVRVRAHALSSARAEAGRDPIETTCVDELHALEGYLFLCERRRRHTVSRVSDTKRSLGRERTTSAFVCLGCTCVCAFLRARPHENLWRQARERYPSKAGRYTSHSAPEPSHLHACVKKTPVKHERSTYVHVYVDAALVSESRNLGAHLHAPSELTRRASQFPHVRTALILSKPHPEKAGARTIHVSAYQHIPRPATLNTCGNHIGQSR